jgi:hypothetical protein
MANFGLQHKNLHRGRRAMLRLYALQRQKFLQRLARQVDHGLPPSAMADGLCRRSGAPISIEAEVEEATSSPRGGRS